MKNSKIYSTLAVTILIALVLRLIGLNSRPIWYDEAFSILLSEKGPAAILNGTLTTDSNLSAAEEHPPAYYFILWSWIQLFGTSLISVRLLSILFSIGTIICIYKIAEHLFNHQTAFVAATLTAILPFQVHYGTEIRMYMILTFWLMLATLAYFKSQWGLFSLAAALAQYTHNLAAIYLIPLALIPFFQRDWKTLRSLTFAGFVSIILYSPWLFKLPAQISKVTSVFWIERPGIEKIFTLLLIYLPHLPLPNSLLIFGLLSAALTIAITLFQTYHAKRNGDLNASKGFWLAYLSFASPGFLWLISQFSPIYVERALLPSHAIFCVWLAWSLTQTKLPRLIQVFTVVLILASAGMGIYQHIVYSGFPYVLPSIGPNIQSQIKNGDVILHSSKLSYLPAFYYDQSMPQGFILDPENSSIDTLSPATRQILNVTAHKTIKNATTAAKRVWFIIYQTSMDEYTNAGKFHPDLIYLNTNFELESTEQWGDLRIYLYSRKTP